MSLATQVSALATRVASYLKASVLPRLLPAGGAAGSVLAKSSTTDYAAGWQTALGLGNGSAAAPTYSFAGATGLGLYRYDVDVLAVAAGSTLCQFWTAGGSALYGNFSVTGTMYGGSLASTGGILNLAPVAAPKGYNDPVGAVGDIRTDGGGLYIKLAYGWYYVGLGQLPAMPTS